MVRTQIEPDSTDKLKMDFAISGDQSNNFLYIEGDKIRPGNLGGDGTKVFVRNAMSDFSRRRDALKREADMNGVAYTGPENDPNSSGSIRS